MPLARLLLEPGSVGSSELSSSQLKVNGSSLVVTSTGEVGIGTTSPQSKIRG